MIAITDKSSNAIYSKRNEEQAHQSSTSSSSISDNNLFERFTKCFNNTNLIPDLNICFNPVDVDNQLPSTPPPPSLIDLTTNDDDDDGDNNGIEIIQVENDTKEQVDRTIDDAIDGNDDEEVVCLCLQCCRKNNENEPPPPTAKKFQKKRFWNHRLIQRIKRIGVPTPTTETVECIYANSDEKGPAQTKGADGATELLIQTKPSPNNEPHKFDNPVTTEPQYNTTPPNNRYTKPLAGTSTKQLKHPNDCNPPPPSPPTPSDNNNNNQQQQQASKVGWVPTPVSHIQVRGPNYLSTKQKIPCPASLYELVRVDVFESQTQMLEIAKRVDLTPIRQMVEDEEEEEGEECGRSKTWVAPDIFLISIALPTQAPSLINRTTNNNQEGYILTGYYRIRTSTKRILRVTTSPTYNPARDDEKLRTSLPTKNNTKQMINGVKLWERWCQHAPTDPSMQARLKFIAKGDNLRDIGCPKWICHYNGTPLLIKRAGKTGFLFTYHETSVMEFDLNLHAFPHLFKSAMRYLKENLFSKMLMTFSFVIEGRSEEELPELLIGEGLKVCFMDPETVLRAEDIFEGSKSNND